MRTACPSFPTAASLRIPSGMMDDLDLVVSAIVVTVLSFEAIVPPGIGIAIVTETEHDRPTRMQAHPEQKHVHAH